MNDYEMYFNGGFSPNWIEDVPQNATLETSYQRQNKSLDTLLSELNEIKEHLQDVQARQWNLAKQLNFHNGGLLKE